MTLQTYADLQSAVADWLNRADLTARIPDFIALAEATLNQVVRSTRMVAEASIALTADTRNAPVPADFLAPVYLQASNAQPLEQVGVQQLVMLRRSRLKAPGTPAFFAVVGRAFEFAPVPDAAGTVDCSYYAQIPPLSDAAPTNWLLTSKPDLYLYTALLHAAPFLRDDERTALFGNLLAQEIQALVQQNATATFDGDPGTGPPPPTAGLTAAGVGA